MDDIMDPALANKIECFMSRKRTKYGLTDATSSRWNGYEYVPRKKLFGNKRTIHHVTEDSAWIF